MISNILTVNGTEWSYLCWSAVKKLLNCSLTLPRKIVANV